MILKLNAKLSACACVCVCACVVCTGCSKKVGIPEYLGKYKFYKKVLDKSCRVQKDLFTDLINLTLGVAKIKIT